MFSLTQREQFVIVTIMIIFFLGLGVKQWRQVALQQSKLKDEVEEREIHKS